MGSSGGTDWGSWGSFLGSSGGTDWGSFLGSSGGTDRGSFYEKEPYWPSEKQRIIVTGTYSSIAASIARHLKSEGHHIIAFDLKKNKYMAEEEYCDEFHRVDLTVMDNCMKVTKDVDHIFKFPLDTGGTGFVQSNNALVICPNTKISLQMLEAAKRRGVKRFFFASIVCENAEFKQLKTNGSVKKSGAGPVEAQDAYVLEKLATEKLCEHYTKYFGIECRIARFHNIYDPFGILKGGMEMAITSADMFEMWGDGFWPLELTSIDNCVEGVLRLTKSNDSWRSLNIGSYERVSMNGMNEIVRNFEDAQCLNSDNFGCALPKWLKNSSSSWVHWIIERLTQYQIEWLKEMQGSIMVVATVIASTTFQIAINPPGGVWQETSNESDISGIFNCNVATCVAGTSVLAHALKQDYLTFIRSNSIAFLSSLSVILLIVGGFPLKNKVCVWLLTTVLCVTLTFTALTFLQGMFLVTPEHIVHSIIKIYSISFRAWLGLLALIGAYHTIHFGIWLFNKVGDNSMMIWIRRKWSAWFGSSGGEKNKK